MKILELSNDRVWITSETNTFGKLMCAAFVLFFGSILFWGKSTIENMVGVIGVFFWLALLTSIAETIFDISNNKIYSKYNLLGLNLRKIEAPIDTSCLLGVMAKYNPNLYLVIQSGKKYRLCDFWSSHDYDKNLSTILKYVPIEHNKSF